MLLICYLSALLQFATPPTFTPKYDLYPIDASWNQVYARRMNSYGTYGVSTTLPNSFSGQVLYSVSDEGSTSVPTTWSNEIHYHDFTHGAVHSFRLTVNSPIRPRQTKPLGTPQRALKNESSASQVPVGDAVSFLLILCGLYTFFKAAHFSVHQTHIRKSTP